MAVHFSVVQDFCLAKRAADFDEASCVSTSVGGDDLSVLDDASSEAAVRQATLVWCHERCHKRESEEARNALGRTGPLVCLKKAAKLVGWCQRSAGQPYVLLTDWREVKPCLSHLEALPAGRGPLLTVVLCDDAEATVYSRASAWARSLGPEAGAVRVVRDLQSALGLLQTARDEACSPCASRQPSKTSCVSRQSSKSSCVSRQPSKCSQPEQPRVPQLCLAPALLCPAEPVPCRAAMATGAWLQQTLSPFGALSPQQLQALLLAAAPASYED